MRVGQGVYVQGMAIHVRLPKADIEERRVMSYLIPHLCLSDAAELDNGRASVIWSVFTSPKIKFFTVRMEDVAECASTQYLLAN